MKKILFASILALSLLSCGENKSQNDIVEKAAENTESSIPIKRLSKTQDIFNGIYYEKIKNDKEIKKVDEKISLMQEDAHKMQSIYSNIISNSEDYYLIAKNEAKSINDSILRKEMMNLITESSDKYYLKVQKIKELKSKINRNKQSIYSVYTALKIRKTLPEIEKYQNAHPLKTDSLNQFINKQNALLEELKN
ncbi:hypothetical protein WH221_04205 [Chryseobacterium culicis]|uniref:Lipoprotein n=1 Tax=Chryseobacterium culicis TaxID=680127 RepID=A0A2S9CY63_CHRCI|nr:hypothetical protein [Chryseobacterium culicis]PRB85459.1 hypothetical protein CQ022_04160 [Chryseobacterium culicis]PRB90821.1 hypothetical protein CQ033_08830 [Chryseobacterium culicis]